MVDFHQSQCFFTIAINVAAMIVQKGSETKSDSVQALLGNCYFLTNIAISGYLPIAFTLFNLYLVNRVHWYIILISAASIVVASVAQGTLDCSSLTKQQNARLDWVFHNGNLRECGLKQPWAYCDMAYSYLSDDPQVVGLRMIGFCTVVVTIVLLSKFKILGKWERWIIVCLERDRKIVRRPQERTDSPGGFNQYSRKARTRRSGIMSARFSDHKADSQNLFNRLRWKVLCVGWPETILRNFVICLYFLIVGIFCWYISIYMKNLRSFATTRTLDPTWGFGQITALLVWAPSVSKYLLLVLRKPQTLLSFEAKIESDQTTYRRSEERLHEVISSKSYK